jgi:hypothetical protein
MIQVNKSEISADYKVFDLSIGKHNATILIGKTGSVNVIVNNACHRAWGGCGKFFNNIEDAIRNYSRPEIKSMLRYCEEN